MKIVFINRYFYPDSSATAQMLTELAEDLDAQGESVTVITGQANYLARTSRLPRRDVHKGIEIRRVGSTNFKRHRFWGRLLDCLFFYIAAGWTTLRLKNQDCLVVLSDPPLLSVLAALVKLLKKVRTVCWLQDVFPEIAIRTGIIRSGLVAYFLTRLGKWSLKKADRIIVIARCMERHLLSTGLPANQLIHISNWADGSLIQPIGREENVFLDEHGLHDRFVVMYSGNLGRVHEFSTVIEMIRRTATCADMSFCFIGEGYHKSWLQSTAQHEGWKHVLFLPFQPKEQLRFSLSAADVHLVLLRQGMAGLSVPSKIYGILACGRPVIFIGPDDCDIAHVVREAACGHVVRPGDSDGAMEALLECYRDPSTRARMGKAGRDYFDRYCDRRIATHRFWQVLQEMNT